ncbi:protein translocase subunit SecF [Paenibacillus sp. SC116]|uniref:protein translocase subunit SecF n=1 Tax=Paenibacillus sp. SC116 TaxID=2968986 RepID=UPI00215A6904|nr:protein translocase subunit SecF [Paenibacillus sp. SC116]MCR8845995.1 protein translocase subunit SecF [Paenibacillus sp. SC116]
MNFKTSYNFDFMKVSKFFFIFSIVITLLGVGTLAFRGLNYGVDFSSGTNIDITLKQPVSKQQMEQVLAGYKLEKPPAITEGSERMAIRFTEVLTDTEEAQLKKDIEKLSPGSSIEVNIVDVEIARELQRNAIYSVLIASIGIIIYVSIRFEWRFAIAAIVALLHDAFMVISVFSIFNLEVNLPFIIAVLTIIGFSINDTIVIFDRIRENLRFAKLRNRSDLDKLVNSSVNQTLTRTINTMLTVLVTAICLLIFGSESIRMFSLAIVIGLAFGAYSSIFIASPLWVVLRERAGDKKPNNRKPQEV